MCVRFVRGGGEMFERFVPEELGVVGGNLQKSLAVALRREQLQLRLARARRLRMELLLERPHLNARTRCPRSRDLFSTASEPPTSSDP
jgi:hypothetical protein